MDLTVLKILFSRKEVKIIIFGTVISGVRQIICSRYIKNHPEFLEEHNGNHKEAKPTIKNGNKKPRFRLFFSRGGGVPEISDYSVKIIAKVIIKFLAKNGLMGGLMASGG